MLPLPASGGIHDLETQLSGNLICLKFRSLLRAARGTFPRTTYRHGGFSIASRARCAQYVAEASETLNYNSTLYSEKAESILLTAFLSSK